jgi:type IV secretion system protein VirD4
MPKNKKYLHALAILVCLVMPVAWLYLSAYSYSFFAHVETPDGFRDVLNFWSVYGWSHKGFNLAQKLSGAVCLVALIYALFEIYKDRRSLHGEARFATEREIEKAGLYAGKGLIVGRSKGKYLVYGGQQFVLLAAPTRSGKGVGVVIPNLLNYHDSVVLLDMKLENWRMTSAYRQRILKQEVFLFCPFAEDKRSHCLNPLDNISRDPDFMVGGAISMAQIFYPSNASDKNRFWNDQAQNLFLGLVLFLIETKHERCTLGEVFRQGSGYDKPLKEHLTEILDKHPQLSRACRDALGRVTSTPADTFGNIKASFDAPMLMFANPLVDAATSKSDFNLSEVRRKRMSIYFGVTPNKLSDASRLINLFFTQVVSLNSGVLPEDDPSLKYQCLLGLDEFTAFGKVAIIAKSVSYLAGYNMRLMTIIQSKSQLKGENLYVEADADNMVSNHELKIVFTPESKDAKDISEMLGTYTKRHSSTSSSRSSLLLSVHGNGNNSVNESDQRRALMLPQELRMMPLTQQLIDVKGVHPILCDKVHYYKEAVFVDRLKMVSPQLRELGSALPSRDQLETARNAGEFEVEVPLVKRVHLDAFAAVTPYVVSAPENTIPNTEAKEFAQMVERDFGNSITGESLAFGDDTMRHPMMRVAEQLASELPDFAAMETVEDYKLEVQRLFFEKVVYSKNGDQS